jgi:hypothetical protein
LEILEGSGTTTAAHSTTTVNGTNQIAGSDRCGIKFTMSGILFQAWSTSRLIGKSYKKSFLYHIENKIVEKYTFPVRLVCFSSRKTDGSEELAGENLDSP